MSLRQALVFIAAATVAGIAAVWSYVILEEICSPDINEFGRFFALAIGGPMLVLGNAVLYLVYRIMRYIINKMF